MELTANDVIALLKMSVQRGTLEHGIALAVEYMEKAEQAVVELRRDVNTLTKQRDNYRDQLSRVESRLQWSNVNGGQAYILRRVGCYDLPKLLSGELDEKEDNR